MTKEKELRLQLQELREAKVQLQDIEMQLGERKGSSSGHARREAELRIQLRDAKSELEESRQQALQKDERLQTAIRKEQELRERLKNSKTTSEETMYLEQDLKAQLQDAELELQTLQRQVGGRELKLQASLRRENELRSKFRSMQAEADNTQTHMAESRDKTHEKEIRGLAKQIQYMRARCSREEGFRKDLVFTKRWFLMQVEMYGACNKADLKLLEEIGVTPDQTVREKKPSLKIVGLAIMATQRMQRMQQSWAGNKKLHESLMKKLEGLKRRQGKVLS